MSPIQTKETEIPAYSDVNCVLDGKRYSTSSARQIAYVWLPGHEMRYYSTAKRLHLFVTNKGNYFCQELETRPDSDDIGPFGWVRIRPLNRGEALEIFLRAPKKLVSLGEAFQGYDVDA